MSDWLRIRDVMEALTIASDGGFAALRRRPDFPQPFRLHPGGHPRWARRAIEQFKTSIEEQAEAPSLVEIKR